MPALCQQIADYLKQNISTPAYNAEHLKQNISTPVYNAEHLKQNISTPVYNIVSTLQTHPQTQPPSIIHNYPSFSACSIVSTLQTQQSNIIHKTPNLSACSIVTAQALHTIHLAKHMRAADRDEVLASHNFTPHEALLRSLGISTRAWCLLLNSEPVAMWGVGATYSILSNTGAPWLLATPRIYEISRLFMRLSRHYVGLMQRDFPRLENYVHAGNKASIRWLNWCGFQLAPQPKTYGSTNELFYKFWRD